MQYMALMWVYCMCVCGWTYIKSSQCEKVRILSNIHSFQKGNKWLFPSHLAKSRTTIMLWFNLYLFVLYLAEWTNCLVFLYFKRFIEVYNNIFFCACSLAYSLNHMTLIWWPTDKQFCPFFYFFIDLVTMLLTRIWIIMKDYDKFRKIAKAFNKAILIQYFN